MNLIIKLVTLPFALPYRILLAIRSFYIFKVRSTIAGLLAGTKTAAASTKQLLSSPKDDSTRE